MTKVMEFNPADVKREWIKRKTKETTMRLHLETEYDKLDINREVFLKAVGIADDHFKRENKILSFQVFNDDYGFLGKSVRKTVTVKNFGWLLKELGLNEPAKFSYTQTENELQVSYWNEHAQKMEHFTATPVMNRELLYNF